MEKSTVNDINQEAKHIVSQKFEDLYYQCGTYEESLIENSSFSRVDFEGVWLNEAKFQECSFTDVLFYDVQGFESKYHNTLFVSTKFKGCNLAEADFFCSIFDGVIFGADNVGTATDISGANLENVEFKDVSFEYAEYDRETKFPDGFNPSSEKGLIIKIGD